MSGDLSRSDYDTFRTAQKDVHAALLALGQAVDAQGLDKALTELVKLRVSQINGCAFCLQLHLTIARKLDIDPAKLDLVATWRDAGIFSPREAAALAWAERLTQLDGTGVPDADWTALRAVFPHEDAVLLTTTVATINAWNRIAMGLRFPPLRTA